MAYKFVFGLKVVLITLFLLLFTSLKLFASDGSIASKEESKIIVSLGDSYSAGEGIEPFYGQDEDIAIKVNNPDWLAHRSQNAWSGMLILPSVGKMSGHKDENWFFVATSGAITDNFKTGFIKQYNKEWRRYNGEYLIEPQLNIFNKLGNNKADYVTVTIGGNDVYFADIIQNCVIFSHININHIYKEIDNIWVEYENSIKYKLLDAYDAIVHSAGEQAHIIVVGYPKLLDDKGGFTISAKSAATVNMNVSKFNTKLQSLVNTCRLSGMNISFVSVEEEFEGHGAYSEYPYLNGIMLSQKQDIKDGVVSAYSMHPNLKGAEAYARCVQARINELENIKATGYDPNFGMLIDKDEIKDNNIGSDRVPIIKSEEETNGVLQQDNNITHKITERSIVLTLDVSNSMRGTPLEETKKAAINFIDSALKEDASLGIVTYNATATAILDITAHKNGLQDIISSFKSHGGTDIGAGLGQSYSLLKDNKSNKKIIVLMSDGEPTDGLKGDELVAYADDIKNSGIYIYTIGFFSGLSDNEKVEAQSLMERIASKGYHYEVGEESELVYSFEDVAEQINGQKYIYVRIACPVDVKIEYNGEMLNSSDKDLNTRTSFGTLTFENEKDSNDKVKVLRLKDGSDYELKLTGTGHGLMNYTIGFMDENGEYSDLRKFENVKINKNTKIDTIASSKLAVSTLDIDEDDDGKYDIRLQAGINGLGEEVKIENKLVYVCSSTISFILLIIILVSLIKVKKPFKTNKKGQ